VIESKTIPFDKSKLAYLPTAASSLNDTLEYPFDLTNQYEVKELTIGIFTLAIL